MYILTASRNFTLYKNY